MRILLLIGLWWFSLLAIAGGRVAIFDYDLRTADDPGVGPYLEAQLKGRDPALEIRYFSAGGDGRQGIAILDRLDGEGWDLIVTITTDAMQLALHRLRRTPFVFTNVNNPRAFGIEPRGDAERRYTGATYYVPIARQLELFLSIQPQIGRLGFLFDANNRAMLVEAQEARQACLERGVAFLYRSIGEELDLAQAAQQLLAEGVDALVATSSDRIYLRIGEIERGTKGRVPIYSFNRSAVPLGAVAALSSDYLEMIDQLVVPRIVRILDGETPGSLPIGYLDPPRRWINEEAIERFGLNAVAP